MSRETPGVAIGKGPFPKVPPVRLDLSLRAAHRSLASSLENWAVVEGAWLRSRLGRRIGKELTIRFRDGNSCKLVVDPRSVEFVIEAIHVASRLGSGPVSANVSRLTDLYQEVSSKLLSVYHWEEIASFHIGSGFPGVKDSLLWLLTRRFRPKLLVETGVAQGVSSAFILDALQLNHDGRLISIDLPDEIAIKRGIVNKSSLAKFGPSVLKKGLEPGWLIPEPLRGRWNLMIGASQDVLPTMDVDVDLFFHDSLHSYEHMTFELNWASSHSHPGTVIVCDDIDRNLSFDDFLTRNQGHWFPVSTRFKGVAIRLVDNR